MARPTGWAPPLCGGACRSATRSSVRTQPYGLQGSNLSGKLEVTELIIINRHDAHRGFSTLHNGAALSHTILNSVLFEIRRGVSRDDIVVWRNAL